MGADRQLAERLDPCVLGRGFCPTLEDCERGVARVAGNAGGGDERTADRADLMNE